MTLRAIAESLGVTPVTVYRRLKNHGVNVGSLRNADGEITTEGAGIIASLFDATPDDAAVQERISTASQSVTVETSQADTAVQMEAAVLRVKLEAAEATVQRLETECDRLRAERDRLLTLLEQEQAQRVRLLEDGGRRRGWFAWLRRGRAD